MGFLSRHYTLLLSFTFIIHWTEETCKCGFGSYCNIFEERESDDKCYCELSDGLYETEVEPGTGCNLLKDHCKENPCKNGGTCIPTFGSYNCICSDQHYGQSCHLNKNGSAISEPAQNIMAYFNIYEQKYLDKITFHVLAENLGEQFSLVLDDGNGFNRTEADIVFTKQDPYSMCLKHMNNYTEADSNVCKLIPQRMMYVGITDLKYPVVKEGHRSVKMGQSGPIGRLDKLLLSVSNGDQQVFSSTYNIFTYFDTAKTACMLSIKLEQCSMEMKSPVAYSRTSYFVFRAVLEPAYRKYPCTLVTDVEYTWHITGPNVKKTFQGDTVLRLKGMDFNFGTYMVEYTHKLFGTPELGVPKRQYTNFQRCWFNIEPKPVVAAIAGGLVRTYAKNTSIEFNASMSFDPNKIPDSRLRYRWTCDNMKYKFCREYSEAMKSRSFVLKRISTLKFSLTVSIKGLDEKYAGKAFQTVRITNTNPDLMIEGFEIMCLKNCYYTNFKEVTILQLKRYPNSGVVWTYSEKDGAEEPVESIIELGTPQHGIIIKEKALEPGKTYWFKATYGPNLNIYEIKTNSRPSQGLCTVSPTSGEATQTLFVVNCEGFEPESEVVGPLVYELYEVHSNFPDVLVAFSIEKTMSNLQFGSGNLKVKVLDRMGTFVEQQLTIQLSHGAALTDNKIEDLLNKISGYLLGNDLTRAMSVVNFISSEFDNIKDKSNLLDNLVYKISKIKLHEVSDAKAVLGSISYLLSKMKSGPVDFLKSETMRLILIILKSITATVKSLRIQAASTLVGEELISLSELTVGALITTISISRDRRVTDKPNSRPEDYEKSFNDYKEGSTEMLTCVENLGDALLDIMSPFQTPYKISQNELIAMETKVQPVEHLLGSRTDPSGDGNALVSFDQHFGEQYKGKILELQVTEFKKPPFWWKETKLALNTYDLNVKIRFRDKNGPLTITKLKSPFKISLKVNNVPSKIISGEVTQPKSSISSYDRDVYVSIHKIDRPKKGYGNIVFNFSGIVEEEFDVLMLVNELPEYDLVRKKGKKINITHSLYSTGVSNDTDIGAIIYLGILPSVKHSGGEVLNYSFQVFESSCRVWTSDSWDIGVCSVSTDAGNIIHCHCTHLSLFGGSLLVPPSTVNPITDLKLFKTLIDNPYVLMLVALFLIIYLGLFIWADKMDRKDIRERGIIQLKDNFPGDKFGYLFAVFTSERANSGTSSNVGVMLIGTKGQSHPHILNHDKNLLQLGQDNWFLIYTENHLGKIKQLHVWHDNSGPNPDWFCFKILVYDLASDQQYLFPVGKWLSVTTVKPQDWKLELMLEPEKYEEINWQVRAKENFFAGLRELHIWFSIFVRHPRSPYTRRQRLTIGLIIILISMLASIMFYGAAEAIAEDDPTYSVGVREIIAILQATCISIAVSVIAAKLFMLSWPPKVLPPPAPTVSMEPKKELPWYRPATIKKRLLKIREKFGNLILAFLIMDPLLPVQLNAEQPITETAKSKKKRRIFLIIAWTINTIIIITCCFFLVLYGLKFGPNKSIIWVSVVLMNIGKAIFLTQPLKIIMLSLLVAVVLKMENRDQLTFEVDPEGVDESLKDNAEFMTELLELRSQPMYHPLPDIDVMVGHQARMKSDKHRWNNINFCFVLVTYFFIIIIVLTLSSQTSPRHTRHITNIIKGLVHKNAPSLNEVHSKTKFIEYLTKTLIPLLHQKRWLNNELLSREREEKGEDEQLIKGWALDYVNKLIGVPRLRQLRVTNDTCTVPNTFSMWFKSCNNSLTSRNIEIRSFGAGWIKRKPYVWNYSSPKHSESLDLYGASGYYYPGGGYIQNLSRNSWDSIRKLTKLNIQNWLDERTRLIIFEFNLFNVHSSLFSIVTVIVENLASGVYTTRIYVDSAFHEFYMEDLDIKLITVLCFLVVILILSIIRIIIHVSVKGMAVYFKQWGHMLDFLIIFFGFTSIIAAIVRAIYFKTYSDIFEDSLEQVFVSLSYPFYQNDLTRILLSIFVVVTTIRLCWLCHYGRYFFIMRRALFESLQYLIVVMILTIIAVTLLAALMYSCGKQTSVLFPALPVPRIRFKDLERNTILQAERTFSICLNFIYFFSGILILSILIYFYGKAKHRLLWYNEGSEYVNRFLDIYSSLVNELSALLGAVKGDNTLRLKGGNYSMREQILEGSSSWDEKTQTKRTNTRRMRTITEEWGRYGRFKASRQQCIYRRGSAQESTEEMIHWLNRTTTMHNKICSQLDMIAEILDKQYEESFCDV